jgi:hypothetical protein
VLSNLRGLAFDQAIDRLYVSRGWFDEALKPRFFAIYCSTIVLLAEMAKAKIKKNETAVFSLFGSVLVVEGLALKANHFVV